MNLFIDFFLLKELLFYLAAATLSEKQMENDVEMFNVYKYF